MTLNPDLVRARCIVAPDLAERLQRMARFRNLLVHVYWNLDHRQVHKTMREDLGDLRAFAAAVVALL